MLGCNLPVDIHIFDVITAVLWWLTINIDCRWDVVVVVFGGNGGISGLVGGCEEGVRIYHSTVPVAADNCISAEQFFIIITIIKTVNFSTRNPIQKSRIPYCKELKALFLFVFLLLFFLLLIHTPASF